MSLMVSCSDFDTSEKDFSTIYFEPFPEDQADIENPFSIDNDIYKIGKKFTYEFVYKDSIGTIQDFYVNRADFSWQLGKEPKGDFARVDKIELSVSPRGKQDSTYHQTNIIYRLLDKNNSQVLLSGTGLVENEKNIWIHPPRQGAFKVLQLSPFPFIQKPYEVGNEFYWQFTVGEHYSDPRYCAWTGLVKIKNHYTILDNRSMDTPFGQTEIMEIKGVSTSRLGSSQLIAYFSKQFGFIELRYTNIDKSMIEMKLVEVVGG